MVDRVLKLSRRYEAPGAEPFDSVTLREPTYGDIFVSGLGRPVEWQPSRSGEIVRIVHADVIDSYVQRLLRSPAYGHVEALDAVDALALAEEVCGFFRPKTDTKKPQES